MGWEWSFDAGTSIFVTATRLAAHRTCWCRTSRTPRLLVSVYLLWNLIQIKNFPLAQADRYCVSRAYENRGFIVFFFYSLNSWFFFLQWTPEYSWKFFDGRSNWYQLSIFAIASSFHPLIEKFARNLSFRVVFHEFHTKKKWFPRYKNHCDYQFTLIRISI